MTEPVIAPTFLPTQEYQRFAEFADAVRRDRYIGLCYGPPGVGKTLSARHYSHWDATENYLTHKQEPTLDRFTLHPPEGLDTARTVFWTAPVTVTAGQVSRHLLGRCHAVDTAIRRMPDAGWRPRGRGTFPHVELIVVDEADRLKTTSLEQLRDIYDDHQIGLVLIGMPGLQRRLTRYPQLYSRVGFAHEYRPLSRRELLDLLQHHAPDLGLRLPAEALTDPDALAAIVRITGGNFRLLQRLFAQINRIAAINDLDTVTRDVVDIARESLIIGAV
jgi:DNA transposition AAA+ family ATPase